MSDWQAVTRDLPADGQVVWTKIDDHAGARNECTLKRRGALWFFPDESMYVYYTPTHWREVEASHRAGANHPDQPTTGAKDDS